MCHCVTNSKKSLCVMDRSKMVIKPRKDYLKYCESKAFLAFNILNKDGLLQNNKNVMKAKVMIEVDFGANIGYSMPGYLTDFPHYGKSLGAGSICLGDDLGLQLNDEQNWEKAYWQYGNETKYGHLIIAGTAEEFQRWTKTINLKYASPGRLFAYIQHNDSDEGGQRGYIVAVGPEIKQGSATVRDGKGYMLYHNGSYYHGDLKIGYKSGKGKFTWMNGDLYEGEFNEDKMNGRGTFKWLNGDMYDGCWKNGRKHGRGTYTFANGSVKTGEFSKDQLISWL